jgi:hypothetical protein
LPSKQSIDNPNSDGIRTQRSHSIGPNTTREYFSGNQRRPSYENNVRAGPSSQRFVQILDDPGSASTPRETVYATPIIGATAYESYQK